MSWLAQTLDDLASNPVIGYLTSGVAAAEPTALAALALRVHGRMDPSQRAAEALVSMQQDTGAVGVRPGETPGWPTSLAIVAWANIQKASGERQPTEVSAASAPPPILQTNIDRATSWLLVNRGRAIPRSADFGHNSQLIGWAYAENTHSWIEPTAMAVLALTAAGHLDHSATQEGIAVLLDRQLPGGGFNYGNTYVLGQLIRPHIQPTGIALLTLAVCSRHAPRDEPNLQDKLMRERGHISRSEMATITKSIAWLRRTMNAETTPMSLAWGLLGLKAQGVEMAGADDWLAAAVQRVNSRDRSPHKLALLALAAKGWPT